MTGPLERSAIAIVFSLAFAASPLPAQYGPQSSDSLPNNYPPPLPARRGPAPHLVFKPAGEIPLPGPLASREAWAADGSAEVPLASGVARVAPAAGERPLVAPGVPPPPEASDAWVLAPGGRRRYRTTPEGIVEAEKRASHRRRWKLRWRIVAPNSTLAPPLLLGPRLCYPGLDDRVTCVRASNGHRLWTADLGDRLSRPIAAWPPMIGTTPEAARHDRVVEGEVLLVVPDAGAAIVALDAYDGSRVASYDLPAAQGHFVSPPLVFRKGRIAVVRKGYAEDEVALTLFDLVPAPPSPAGAPSAVPYNGGTAEPKANSGR